MDSPIYVGMVRFAALHPAQARDFNLTERQLPGWQRGTKISKQKALEQTFFVALPAEAVEKVKMRYFQHVKRQ